MDKMETVDCLICGRNRHKIIAREVQFGIKQTVVICCHCGLVFLNPRKSKEEYAEYYRNDYWDHYDFVNGPDGKMAEWWASQGEYLGRLIQGRMPQGSAVLEIGCGGGGILAALKQRGYSVLGLDTSLQCSAFARDTYGVTVVPETIDVQLRSGKKYSFIILSHVVEHFFDPIVMLQAIAQLLLPGGMIYVEVPNVRDVPAKTGLEESFFRFPHLWYFSPATFRIVLDRSNLQILYSDKGRGSIRHLVCPAHYLMKQPIVLFVSEYYKTLIYLFIIRMRRAVKKRFAGI